MPDFDKQIQECEREEREIVFERFTNQDALALGLAIVDRAGKKGANVTIDVERSGQKLFHHAMEGTSPDNDQWIRRKNNVVMRTFQSSFHVGLILKRDDLPLEKRYFLDPMEYSAHGGSFPVRVQGVGVVGTIAVSGLPQAEDHRLVVETIRDYLKDPRTR